MQGHLIKYRGSGATIDLFEPLDWVRNWGSGLAIKHFEAQGRGLAHLPSRSWRGRKPFADLSEWSILCCYSGMKDLYATRD